MQNDHYGAVRDDHLGAWIAEQIGGYSRTGRGLVQSLSVTARQGRSNLRDVAAPNGGTGLWRACRRVVSDVAMVSMATIGWAAAVFWTVAVVVVGAGRTSPRRWWIRRRCLRN